MCILIYTNELDTPQEYMMLGKIIQEPNQEGFLSNRDSTGNLFVTKNNERKMQTKLYKELNGYEAKNLFRLRSNHAGVGYYKARFWGERDNCPKCGSLETIEHLLIVP
jgi:hypothetical protein